MSRVATQSASQRLTTGEIMQDVLGLILGGGRGKRLFPLTMLRSKPAVPIAGKYRLIDIPISNCLHAGLKRIFVLTQFNSASLNRHISNTYRLDRFSGGFVVIDADRASAPLREFAIRALHLEQIESDGPFELYRPAPRPEP